MKILKNAGLVTAIFFCMLMAQSADAHSLYRCGKTYQDRPCENAQGSKLIGGSSGGVSSAASHVTDTECAKRGADAQKIVWGREAGAMLDQQLAKANSVSEQKLINDVYARRGTSSDIRAAIEEDCIAAKERAARAAALLEAANAGQQPSNPTVQAKTGDAAPSSSKPVYSESSSAREASLKKVRCDFIKTRLDKINSQQHTGGNAAKMDDLNQQKRDAEHRLNTEGC